MAQIPEKDNEITETAVTVDAGYDQKGAKEKGGGSVDTSGKLSDLLYSVEEVPPWGLCILLGFQHYLTAFGGIVTVPLILNGVFCIAEDRVGLSELIGTIFFCSGMATLLQTTLGVRLPIIQGGSFTFLTPTFALLSLPKWSCEYTEAANGLRNITDLPPYGSLGHQEIWHMRLREVQGAIMVASLFQVVIGFSGLMGVVLRFIGPLAVTPTVALIGLGLFPEAADLASKQWYIAVMTMVLIALFSQYLRNITLPRCGSYKLPIFKLFPVLIAMMSAWGICGILTAAGVFPTDQNGWGYEARTDTKLDVLRDSKWFRFPYPGQWGVPTVSTAGVFGMLAGVISSMIESVGDYIACARLSGAPPPPDHAVNRGIGMEGIGCILAGAWGSGSGTTSYSENIGAIGITKVGSRRVVQVGGCMMLILGCLGKFGALFVTIPDPVIGGMFLIMFGMVVSVGLSNLQFVDLSSSRNIFVLGTSLFFGLSFPVWIKDHPNSIDTGNEVVDQILSVLLGTNMFVGGVVGLVLDNTVPGTDEERGIKKWREITSVTGGNEKRSTVYDIPFIQPLLDKMACWRYVPMCPAFNGCRRRRHSGYVIEKSKSYVNEGFAANIDRESTAL
ncbi:solute carrier family 23 member 1-like [Mizuhopecten yessoensis]|uniref:Solute carrier family 23 member 2 n=1 Tax=Mizuhopecten yessoensis TaxID=6573 RepID=A0A210R693_MIZYE|nr:solute carrier family 23 member 1-like [Mizuhopecten yessoensis]OWF56540.1 Solute carrier family 23 member 2 [Mizuhopecten yessoensis]